VKGLSIGDRLAIPDGEGPPPAVRGAVLRATIRVPATSANLGSGFDTLGLALALYNRVVVVDDVGRAVAESPSNGLAQGAWLAGGRPRRERQARIIISGEGEDILPRDETNLVYRTILRYFEIVGRSPPAFTLETHNRIPLTGGLGSSSAALVGGLLAANALAGGLLTRDEILKIAHDEEGHPDNVAPALLGGLVLCVADADRLTRVALPVPVDVRAVLFVPSFTMPTEEARRLLPSRVPYRDAVFNLGRAALLIAAFQTGQLELLRIASEDRLHQPYRREMFPAMPRFIGAALQAGALGACLSGAGSAIISLTRGREREVADAYRETAVETGVSGRITVIDIDRQGAQVELEGIDQLTRI
jgi:homoserine kinase